MSIFAADILLCIIAEGLHFFKNPLHSLDIVVISLSMYFEIEADNFSATIVILVRIWRFLRLVHGTVEIIHEDNDEEVDKEGQVELGGVVAGDDQKKFEG